MIRYVLYNLASGEILQSGVCTPATFSTLGDAETSALADEAAEANTHKVVDGVVVPYTEAGKLRKLAPPGIGFRWDPSAENWIDERVLEQMQGDLLAAVKRERDARIESGFEWDGSPFDSDAAISQPRLLGLFTTALAGGLPPEGYAWRLANNSWRVLSAADAAAVWGAFQAHMAAHFAAFAAHEAAVLAETDTEALQAYDTAAGWPS